MTNNRAHSNNSFDDSENRGLLFDNESEPELIYYENSDDELPFPVPKRQRNYQTETAIENQPNGWQQILEKLDEEKKFFYVNREFEREKIKVEINWEMYKLLELFGRVGYLTNGQALRYLTAWQRFFDSEIRFGKQILKMMVMRGLIEKLHFPLKFHTGVLKGKSLEPYYLTTKGYNLLKLFDDKIAALARFGTPKPGMAARLRHELMISEVYLHLTEQSHYVVAILTEEELRRRRYRDILQSLMNGRVPDNRYQAIGDFRIFYFDRDQAQYVVRNGEVAVRYTREQILSKAGDFWWFCYDVVEARKIEYLTNRKATILTDKIFGKERNKKYIKKYSKGKNAEVLEEWYRVLNGFTIQAAAYLANVHYLTARKILDNSPNLRSNYHVLTPGSGAGRGIKLYLKEELTDDLEAVQETLTKNLLLHYLGQNNYRGFIEDDQIKTNYGKERLKTTVLFDGSFWQTEDLLELKREKFSRMIEEIFSRGEQVLFAVLETQYEFFYKEVFPNVTVINLSECNFTYLK